MLENCLIFKLSSKNQIVVPRIVRKQLRLHPGDRIRYRVHGKKVFIEKMTLPGLKDDPFTAFDEWSSAADNKAFADL